jgi:hypothetical protein
MRWCISYTCRCLAAEESMIQNTLLCNYNQSRALLFFQWANCTLQYVVQLMQTAGQTVRSTTLYIPWTQTQSRQYGQFKQYTRSSQSENFKTFQMRLWALLLAVVGWLGVVAWGRGSNSAPSNRTKRQFEASHCDPAICQIPVSSSWIFSLPSLDPSFGPSFICTVFGLNLVFKKIIKRDKSNKNVKTILKQITKTITPKW